MGLMELIIIILTWIMAIILTIALGTFVIYLITRLITTVILMAKEEFYEQRSKTKTSCACTRDKR